MINLFFEIKPSIQAPGTKGGLKAWS